MSLPPLLQAYVDTHAPSVPATSTGVLFHQEGHMRLGPDKPWVPFTAEQTMRADTTAFRWHARVKMAPLMTAIVDDAYEDKKGLLDAKLFGLIPVAHGEGPRVDRGEVQRYLAELPWCPHAFERNPDLRFEQRDDVTVRVWCEHDPDAHVDLQFKEGNIVGAFTERRPRDDSDDPWQGRFTTYGEHQGVRLPVEGEVQWNLPDGPFAYWRGRITAWETT